MKRLSLPVWIVVANAFVACTSSQWSYVRDGAPGKVVTEITVTTEPPGAEVSVNGAFQGETPILVPVRYRYFTRVYQRRTVVPYPQIEEKDVRTYEMNEFKIRAILPGYDHAEETITLHGEETKEVVIALTPS